MAQEYFIESENKYAKFNTDKFQNLFIPDDMECSNNKRYRELGSYLKGKNLPTEESTIRYWYKGKNTPCDIAYIEAIAEFLACDKWELLEEVDKVKEYMEKSNAISEKRTFIASIQNVRNYFFSEIKLEDPNYKPWRLMVLMIGFVVYVYGFEAMKYIDNLINLYALLSATIFLKFFVFDEETKKIVHNILNVVIVIMFAYIAYQFSLYYGAYISIVIGLNNYIKICTIITISLVIIAVINISIYKIKKRKTGSD